MRPRLFEDLLGSARVRPRTRSARTLPISVLLHAAALAAVVVLPLLAQEPLPPLAPGVVTGVKPPQIVVVKPPPAAAASQKQTVPKDPGPKTPRPEEPPPFTAPTIDPETLVSRVDLVPDPVGGEPGIPGGTGERSDTDGWQPLVPVPENPPTTPIVLRGTTIERPRKLRNVAPVYPELAINTRLQGVVLLDCTINPRGQVVDVQVVSGPALLRQAAIDAVSQWLYSPTLLNGAPVPVVLTVEVGFILR